MLVKGSIKVTEKEMYDLTGTNSESKDDPRTGKPVTSTDAQMCATNL
jgi:predicted NAD/FAD-dependent oxidoreductase